MLSAPNNSSHFASSSDDKLAPISSRTMTALYAAIAVYSFLVGVTLWRGTLPVGIANFLLAPVPFSLALWYGYGFMQPSNADAQNANHRNANPDFGLLLLCGGWSLTTLALLMPTSAPASNAGQNNVGAMTVTAIVCSVLGLLCLVLGTALSLRTWSESVHRS